MNAGLIEVGQDRFPVAIQGDGPPVLFVHGAPGDWRTFAPHAARLSDRYRCITFTQRWFGTTEWREDGPRFGTGTHARDLIALAEALDLGPLAIVSWSYGTHGALKAALDRPELFYAHVAYEPGFGSYVEKPAEREAFVEDAKEAWRPVFAARNASDETIVRAMWDASGGHGSFDRLTAEERQPLVEGAPALRRLLEQAPPEPISCGDLRQMLVPTAIGRGTQSRPCYSIPARTAVECIGCDEFTIDGANHMWPQLSAEGFANVVGYWLDQLSPEQFNPVT